MYPWTNRHKNSESPLDRYWVQSKCHIVDWQGMGRLKRSFILLFYQTWYFVHGLNRTVFDIISKQLSILGDGYILRQAMAERIAVFDLEGTPRLTVAV